MSSWNPAAGPDLALSLADLHARYDGRPPRRWRLAALAGGDEVLNLWQGQAQDDRLAAQCAGARLALARRRRQLPADAAAGDAWLNRLSGALRDARHAIMAR